MSTVEKILKANRVLTTTVGSYHNEVVIAWDELGMIEEARFEIDADLSDVYEFLGY